MYGYEPIDGDFPLDIPFSKQAVFNLISTKSKYDLEESNPYVWTQKRLKLVETTSDYYIKYLYLNDHYYAWLIYSLTDDWDLNMSDIDRYPLIGKYISNSLVQMNSYMVNNRFVLLNSDTNVSMLQKCFSIMNDILLKRKSNFNNLKYCFFQDQVDNLYTLNMDSKKIPNIIKNVNFTNENLLSEEVPKKSLSLTGMEVKSGNTINNNGVDYVFNCLKNGNYMKKVVLFS